MESTGNTIQLLDVSIIFQNFGSLSHRQRRQFCQLAPCYERWNKQLNLISRKDIGYLYLKHALHSLCIAKVVAFEAGTRLLDVGTGGGFPGIPLAIMFPQAEFCLIDSVGKKIKAVQHIAKELSLTNVKACQIRAEKVAGKYDFVLGRAVTNLEVFYEWVKCKISSTCRHTMPNGILYLKGTEPVSLKAPHRVYPVSDFFSDFFFSTKQLVHIYT